MGAYCTCGVKLPDEARFCHKCGKPQYDEPLFEAAVEEPVPVVSVAPPPLPQQTGVSFQNLIAVRVGLMAAALVTVLFLFPMPMVLGLILKLAMLLGAGFFAVYLYGRRTGEPVSVTSGARLGWMTGVFSFVIVTVLFTIFVIELSTPEMRTQFSQEAAKQGAPPDMLNQITEALSNPVDVIAMLVFLFFMLTILPVVGGALGAKVLEKE